ncbi:MAG: hypothetical protein ACRDQX_16165 [Pseudonocardiaceae bacterium]
MTQRNPVVHRVLSMVDAGWCTRGPGPGPVVRAWRVSIDGSPAPDKARWALIVLAKLGLIMWWDVGNGIHLATVTPHGLQRLRIWDTELLNPASGRSLSGLNATELNNEARRLIDAAFNDSPQEMS